MEKTLVFLKPDSMIRRYVGARILKEFLDNGLSIEYIDQVHPSKDFFADKHYAVHKGKFFFDWLVDYVTISPVILVILYGNNTIECVRGILGATLPEKASCDTIRGKYGIVGGVNAVHASDTPETAEEELKIWKEIIKPQEGDYSEFAKSYIDKYIDSSIIDSIRYREVSINLKNNFISESYAKNIFIKFLKKESDYNEEILENFAGILVENVLLDREKCN